MTRTIVYQTRDNEKFNDAAQANLHETSLDLLGIFIESGLENDGKLKLICLKLAKDFDKYEAILTKLRVLHGKVKKARTTRIQTMLEKK